MLVMTIAFYGVWEFLQSEWIAKKISIFATSYAEEVLNIISKKQILIDSEKIQIGENANQKAVRGEDMVKMIDEFFSIIEELPLKLLTPVGTTLGASPDVIAKMTNFRAKYLSTSNPILSKKILIE